MRRLLASLLWYCVAVSSFTLPITTTTISRTALVRPPRVPDSYLSLLPARNDDDDLPSSASLDHDEVFSPRIALLSMAAIVTAAAVVFAIPTHDFPNVLAQAADFPFHSILDSTALLASQENVDATHSILTTTTTTLATASIPSTDISSAAAAIPLDPSAIFEKALKKAVGGGKAGASAAVVQVLSLMWLRTAMNYQYRYGGDLPAALKTLWSQGGIPRLYQGLPFALVQGPLTRFGDTAANVGMLALLGSLQFSQAWPITLQTAFGSAAAGLWRVVLLPIDSSKTAMQVEGADGLKQLWSKVLTKGDVRPLYQGAVASAAATVVGHFPWFVTYNALNEALPVVDNGDVLLSLLRSAFLGLCASCVSDTCSNSLRVIKTTKQTAQLLDDGGADTEVAKELSWQEYKKVVTIIVEKDGLQGLFGRGLKTRLLTNAIQGSLFSVLWRYFQQVGGSSS